MLKNTHIHKALILLIYFQFVPSVPTIPTIFGKRLYIFNYHVHVHVHRDDNYLLIFHEYILGTLGTALVSLRLKWEQ